AGEAATEAAAAAVGAAGRIGAGVGGGRVDGDAVNVVFALDHVHDLGDGDEAIAVAVVLLEFVHRLAGRAPFEEADLAVAVGIDLLEPGGQLLGELAGAVDDGLGLVLVVVFRGGGGRGVVHAEAGSLAHTLGHGGPEVGLELVEVDDAV